MSGVRVALRIARRDALRSKGRSALVVAMIGVPMLGLAFVDVAVRTAQLPAAERARRVLGAADVVATLVASEPIVQHGPYGYGSVEAISRAERGDGGLAPPEKEPDVGALLPPGSRVTRWNSVYITRFRGGDRVLGGVVEQLDLHDPITAGLVRLRSGAFPRAAGETAVTTELARRLGIRPGGTVEVVGMPERLRVTGVVTVPSSLEVTAVYVSPATAVPDGVGLDGSRTRRWVVDLPPGTRDTDLVAPLNQQGISIMPRSWVLDPPPDGSDPARAVDEAGIAILVVGLAALEIVLLAGTAFAVGARRRRRDFALIAATGGDRRDVRRVVFAGAVVVGAVAGAVGVAGGILGVVLLRPFLERTNNGLLGPLDVRPLELAAVVALGAGTALLAALLPARAAARMPVVAALTGRRGDARLRRRVPILALVAVAAGTALAFWAAGDAATGPDPGRRANYPLVLLGAAVAELGFAASAPGLVTLVGALAARLPLSLRLAARDAARHRTRSGPAVAAIVAAVAGSVALSVYVASDSERARAQYQPFLAAGAVRLGTMAPTGPVPPNDVDAAVATLPVRERVDAYDVAESCAAPDEPCANWTPALPERHGCAPNPSNPADLACWRRMPMPGGIAAGPPSLVEVVTGRHDARAEAALRDGKAVVFDERWLVNGTVTLVREVYSGQASDRTRVVAVPAVAFPAQRLGEAPAVVLSRETAQRHGLPTQRGSVYVLTSRTPTPAEEAAARGALSRSTPYGEIYVERGARTMAGVEVLVLTLAAGLVTLAATGIATGLAAADSRPDLATLAAVGAAPRIRRRLVMAQAATVAALGSALGLFAGLVPAIAVVSSRADVPLALPWRSFAITVVGVPLVAALLVGAFTRGRLPLERRLA